MIRWLLSSPSTYIFRNKHLEKVFLGQAVKIHCILCLKINNGCCGVDNAQEGRTSVACGKMEWWGEVSCRLARQTYCCEYIHEAVEAK
jgi:hypothetical protein